MEKNNKTEIIKIELEQALISFRTEYTLLTQIIAVLTAGNITVIGFAFNSEKSIIFIIGALFPLLIYHFILRARHMMLPIIFTALSIENKLEKQNEDWIIMTFLSYTNNLKLLNKLVEISKIENRNERMIKLNEIKNVNYIGSKLFISFILLLLAVLQIISAILLNFCSGWDFI